MEKLKTLLAGELKCPICLCTLHKPVSTTCGHNFCQSCLAHSIRCEGPKKCSICRKALSKAVGNLVVNHALWSTIQVLFPEAKENDAKEAKFRQHLQHLQAYGSIGAWAEDLAVSQEHGSESELDEEHSHHNFIIPARFFGLVGLFLSSIFILLLNM